MTLPNKYDHLQIEQKWKDSWESQKTYQWDPNRPGEETFSIDTPPPTVSGSLHVGHVFSYTQTDVIARYQRMKGKNIFYPMGWDDNGLPTERRVQNVFNITCDPSQPYMANWTPVKGGSQKEVERVSRKNFIEACLILTHEDEKAFEDVWRQLSLSVDWALQYATIDAHCQRISQLSFLDMVSKGVVYNLEAPTMWDVDFRTAVAQAEIEDRNRPGAYHHIKFGVEDGGDFTIATTRPELLAACIAVVAHPDDSRYQALFGKNAITPLFKIKVPILPSTHADPEKGSGILMVCTFGDAADVDWWKSSHMPIKQIVGLDGRLLPIDFTSEQFKSNDPTAAAEYYSPLVGLKIKAAQTKIVELLATENSGYDGNSIAMPTPPQVIEHPVKFYEKGDSPIEFMTSRQWFVKILDHKTDLIAQGDKIKWHPAYMKSRYTNWVEGLNQDWCISRQRFFGVPFPVWYPVNALGQTDYAKPIFATADQLPIDPMSDAPKGYSENQRNQPNGFSGDPDVMDTWATSSLTPQIASHWLDNPERHAQIFPMDIRPQSHEIIRTWAFYTITKAWFHGKQIPWKNVAISGWVLDPDRKKMSKSKGNVVTPNDLLVQYSSDAVRYWAARAKLGSDTAFDPSVFQIGQKLSTKIFNASKFVVMQMQGLEGHTGLYETSDITHPTDIAMIHELRTLILSATNSLENLDYAAALEATESSFWKYCDHFIELVKIRSYRDENLPRRKSALATLQESLKIYLQLFAPFLPYITEEVWSWVFATPQHSSIHKSPWPTVDQFAPIPKPPTDTTLTVAIDVLSQIRAAKTDGQKSLKHPVTLLKIAAPKETLIQFDQVKDDIIAAGVVENYEVTEASETIISVNL